MAIEGFEPTALGSLHVPIKSTGGDELLSLLAKIDETGARTAASLDKLTASSGRTATSFGSNLTPTLGNALERAERSAGSFQRVERQLGNLALVTAGFEGPVGKLGEAFALFAVSGATMATILGILIVGFITWKNAIKETSEELEQTERFTKHIADLGPQLSEEERRHNAIAHAVHQQAKAKLELAAINAIIGEQAAGQPSWWKRLGNMAKMTGEALGRLFGGYGIDPQGLTRILQFPILAKDADNFRAIIALLDKDLGNLYAGEKQSQKKLKVKNDLEDLRRYMEDTSRTIGDAERRYLEQSAHNMELGIEMDKKRLHDLDELRKKMEEQAKRAGELVGRALADGLHRGFQALFKGENIVTAIGASVMESLGDFLTKLGEKMVTTALMTQTWLANLLSDPPASLAAGLGVLALGEALRAGSSALSGGGVSSGGYGSSGGFVPGDRAHASSNYGSSAAAMPAVNLFVIGEKDPAAAASITRMVQSAVLRGMKV